MEIRKWQLYVVFNCALIYCGVAKTFSLNEAIAAESRKQIEQTTISAKLEESPSERYSLIKAIKPKTLKRKLIKDLVPITPLSEGISSLKYRKNFQIKSPLKPKKLKYIIGTKQKRNNQAYKREINGNDKLKQKHIPLLKSLSMLLDNILGPDSRESSESKRKTKRARYYFGSEETCKCATKSEPSLNSQDEADSVSEPLPAETSFATEAPAETTHTTTSSHILNIRQNKNIPILFSRNTIGRRRDYNGLRQRSRTPNNWSIKRYITRINGDSKHNTDNRQNESSTASYEENTDSTSRDSASGFRSRNAVRGIRNITRESIKTNTSDEVNYEQENQNENSMDDNGENIDEFQRENKLEIGRNETKSAELIPKPSRRLRGFVSEAKVGATSGTIQSEESNEKNQFDVAVDHAGNQRLADRSSQVTQENKESSEGNEAIKPIQISAKARKQKQGPVVVIIDGYSVTRHKNGENKLSEKAIHIQS